MGEEVCLMHLPWTLGITTLCSSPLRVRGTCGIVGVLVTGKGGLLNIFRILASWRPLPLAALASPCAAVSCRSILQPPAVATFCRGLLQLKTGQHFFTVGWTWRVNAAV